MPCGGVCSIDCIQLKNVRVSFIQALKCMWCSIQLIRYAPRTSLMLTQQETCICHHFLKFLTCNFNDLELGLFKVSLGQKSWCQLDAHWWFPIWPPLCPTLYLSCHSRYLMCKFRDLDLGQLKVIRGQRSRCQLIAQGWFHIWLPLTPSWYLSLF